MRNKLTIVCVLAVAACSDAATMNDNDNDTTTRDAGEQLATHDAAQGDAQGALETDAGAADAAAHASDDAGALVLHDAGDAGDASAASDASADTGPPPVVLTEKSYEEIWHGVLAARCFDCHSNIDNVGPVIDLSFGVAPLLKASSCNGMPYVTPGDPSRSLILRAFQAAPPCGPHKTWSSTEHLVQLELDMIAAWIRGEPLPLPPR